MSKKISFPGFSVSVPEDWVDATDSVLSDFKPFSLAKGGPSEGIGALQFSPALYQSGPKPNPSTADLMSMLDEFAANHELGEPMSRSTTEGRLVEVSASYHWKDDFLMVWYLSDKTNVMLITYTCQYGYEDFEINECIDIVRSIVFTNRERKRQNKGGHSR